MKKGLPMGWLASKMGFYFRKLILNWKRPKCLNRDIRIIFVNFFVFILRLRLSEIINLLCQWYQDQWMTVLKEAAEA